MKMFEQFSSKPVAEAIGSAILHSLWQTALVAALLAVFLYLTGQRQARLRYLCAMLSLTVALAWFLFTLGSRLTEALAHVEPVVVVDALFLQSYRPSAQSGATQSVFGFLWMQYSPLVKQLNPWLATAWLTGALLMAIRYCGGFFYLYRLPRLGAVSPADGLTKQLSALCHKAGINRQVRMLESALVKAPFTFGFLKPVIMVPVGLLAGLAPWQVEMLLLHELAHIRRADYLANLFQAFAETLLFYHPLAWWMSETARKEREHCCDDWAVFLAGNNAKGYANTLVKVQENCSIPQPLLAMNAFSNSNQTFQRVLRILGKPAKKRASLLPLLAVIPVSLMFGLGFTQHKKPVDAKPLHQAGPALALAALSPDTLGHVGQPLAQAVPQQPVQAEKAAESPKTGNKALYLANNAIERPVASTLHLPVTVPAGGQASASVFAGNPFQLATGDDRKKLLVMCNGEEISQEALEGLEFTNIVSLVVLSGKEAGAYGEKGKNGVIIVKTRNGRMTSENFYGNNVLVQKNKNFWEKILNGLEKGVYISMQNQVFEQKTVAQNPEKPLILLDGIEVGEEEIKDFAPEQIKSVTVLKGEQAQIYGDKAKHGVVLIASNIVHQKENKTRVTTLLMGAAEQEKPKNQENKPLYIVDGVVFAESELKSLQPDDIAEITVLKDASSTAIYGPRGANGVIIITTKSAKSKTKASLTLKDSSQFKISLQKNKAKDKDYPTVFWLNGSYEPGLKVDGEFTLNGEVLEVREIEVLSGKKVKGMGFDNGKVNIINVITETNGKQGNVEGNGKTGTEVGKLAIEESFMVFPNPFGSVLNIEFFTEAAQQAKLTVLDVTGKEVAVLHQGLLGAQSHSFAWNGANHPNGHYLVVLETPAGRFSKKVVLER